MSDAFGPTGGLKQGCVLSPLLFSLYINLLVEKLRVVGVGVECRARLITALLYADDSVLFGESEEEMRVSLRVLSECCREWSVEIKCREMWSYEDGGGVRGGWKENLSSGRVYVPWLCDYKADGKQEDGAWRKGLELGQGP